MQPLRIDFSLAGAMVVPDMHPPMLDALLIAMATQGRMLPSITPDVLPVQHIKTKVPQSPFFFMASAIDVSFTGPASTRTLHRNPRPLNLLADAAHHNSKRVYLDRGATRTVQTRLQVRQATFASAWCIGERDAIRTLAQRITHLGSHRHLGLGEVLKVSVSEDQEAITKAWLRPIPCIVKDDPYAKSRVPISGQCAPPYWQRTSAIAYWPEQCVA